MQFAAVFVEYLVTGVGVLLWLLLLIGVSIQQLEKLEPAHVTLLLPLVYVTGMFADVAASALLHKMKKRARRKKFPWLREREPYPQVKISRTAFVVLHSPELGNAIQVRTSRDRIARGALLNSFLFALVALIRPVPVRITGIDNPRWIVAAAAALVTLGAFAGWWYEEYHTHRFKLRAFRAIQKKLASEAKRAPS